MRKYVLGLEMGIDGGSIAILENEKLIDSQSGSGSKSKSEDLLSMLSQMLKKNSISKSEIGVILISHTTGSLTGLRIGLATAKGLSDALCVPFRKISILDSMAIAAGRARHVLAAVAAPKNQVVFSEYFFDNQRKGSFLKKIEGKKSLEEFAGLVKNLGMEAEGFQFVFNERLRALLFGNSEFAGIFERYRVDTVDDKLAEVMVRFQMVENSTSDNI